MARENGQVLFDDTYFMNLALQEAEKAYSASEIPVGAIIVVQNRLVARAHNQVEQLQDPTAHAEMLALTSAFHALGGKYLTACTLYVTLEPCLMCSNATYWAQLGRLVFGATDPKRGYRQIGHQALHPRTTVTQNVLATESQAILQRFFISIRQKFVPCSFSTQVETQCNKNKP
ncbi:MAG: nucleoside deaminase [Bacteroidota bacterium]